MRDLKSLRRQSPLEATRSSGGPKSPAVRSTARARRAPLHESQLSGVLAPSVKERLQVAPEMPARKRPQGEEWTPFRSVNRMGPVTGSRDAVGPQRAILALNRHEYDPSYDDIGAEETAEAIVALETSGSGLTQNGPIVETYTDQANEYLYEEVVDSETGKTGLLYRNNIFSRLT